MKYAYLALSVVFNVASYLLYKGISDRQAGLRWFLVLASGLLLGSINVFFFTKALKGISLNVAYPVFSGACIFFMALLSHFIFNERITLIGMAGAAFVAIGIALMLR